MNLDDRVSSSRPSGPPLKGPRPVLVGGCPRSGTTLLGAMLGVGADRVTVPESLFKFRLLRALSPDGELDVAAARGLLSADERFGLWQVPLPSLPDGPARVRYEALVTGLVLRFAEGVGKPQPAVWIDHTPGNVSYASSMARLFPDAKLVHVVRDGRAVAASVLPLDWGPNTAAEAAKWWAGHVATGLAAERRFPGRVLGVRFEDLLADPEATLRAVCDFVGTPYDPAMVGTRDYRALAYTVTEHRLVDEGPDPRRADAWRERLTDGQVGTVEHLTGELLDLLGYRMEYGPRARLGSRAERLVAFTVDMARRASLDRLRRALTRRRMLR